MASSPTAYNLLRSDIHYRRDCFTQGLEAAGYKVRNNISQPPQAGDVLVIWNRYGSFEEQAEKFERAGARVLVVENGYLGFDYAISLSQHHHGSIYEDFSFQDAEVKQGKHILICGQRGIGSKLMASPHRWAEKIAKELKTDREIRIRNHPAKNKVAPLDDDLKDCHACIIWSSCAGIRALQLGVPVIYAAPRWIAEKSAIPYYKEINLEKLPILSQVIGLSNAASNQFSLSEIKSGQPFRELLQ